MRESQGAKLSCCTLRSLAVAGFDVRVLHLSTFFEVFSAKTAARVNEERKIEGALDSLNDGSCVIVSI